MVYHALDSTGALRTLAGTEGDEAPRFRFMPQEIAMRTYRAHRAFYDKLQGGGKLAKGVKRADGKEPVTAASVLLVSGCQDNQYSQDGAFNGAFTGALLRVWKHGVFAGNYRRFHRAITQLMPPTQTPNYFWVGAPNPGFEAQRPFTL
jgi:hypothetical protein